MPHILLEYSKNLKPTIKKNNVLQELHKAVVESNLFSPEAVKARSTSYKNIVLHDGFDSFVHITISILNNKTLEQRQKLSKDIFNLAQELVIECDKISVDIHEMNIETYSK